MKFEFSALIESVKVRKVQKSIYLYSEVKWVFRCLAPVDDPQDGGGGKNRVTRGRKASARNKKKLLY